MPFRPLPLPAHVPGRLWLGPMPGRNEPWSRFTADAQRAGLTRIVCLNPLSEVVSNAPDYHRAIAQGDLPWRWRHLPMRNFGVAFEEDDFARTVDETAQALEAGEVVLLHCAAGLGRTGTAAACVLKRLGVASDEALSQVRAAGSNPQSAQQSGWIDRF